ncbi:hypothetical protein HBI56_028990 [Parastagonospora nodorum]|uniref:Uncharacterized protein n=1 Tax=Phaeosphaeria nodorum (strain SN15 / ATCC MYA-4574 / FGSC 10173) TaxID=321614 RepID=A0A7U2HYK7_PHANO|nr:hypothetical protein HBH56_016600 [Parastagonospora nodorum]QRC95114.1 hypothetical protein JI435_406860 [Parastagonospora nodorum SN15]KAH3936822.1 hypothetical protein HBH54_017860 [Parastagonospora nodorum]KAH3953469.1 hypothetical protein HBH53_030240 [Parastagonospora nodorum]KAH3989979.1 hypothetical protein HBH52_007230 [Parastagonospora nodorum]
MRRVKVWASDDDGAWGRLYAVGHVCLGGGWQQQCNSQQPAVLAWIEESATGVGGGGRQQTADRARDEAGFRCVGVSRAFWEGNELRRLVQHATVSGPPRGLFSIGPTVGDTLKWQHVSLWRAERTPLVHEHARLAASWKASHSTLGQRAVLPLLHHTFAASGRQRIQPVCNPACRACTPTALACGVFWLIWPCHYALVHSPNHHH